ncbi:MAG: MoaD/ThiS family protein [Nitrososphaerales archaeon]
MIRVKLFGNLKRVLEKSEIEIDNVKTVADLLNFISKMIKSETLQLSNTLVIVNGIEVSTLQREETMLKDGDEIVLIPVVHGG